MEIVCPFTTKTVHEAVDGELICFADEQGGELAIKISQSDMGYALLAGFSSSPDRTAHMIQVTGDADCVSYGTRWVFEVSQQASFSFDSALSRQAGAARISGDSVALRFGQNPQVAQLGPRVLNLRTFTAERDYGFAYWTRDWKLWASAGERDRLGGVPLVTGL